MRRSAFTIVLLAACTLSGLIRAAAVELFGAAPAQSSEAQPAPESSSDDSPEVPPEPPRQLSRAELQREIDIVRRDLEELVLRIGDKDPTEKQLQNMHELSSRFADLKRQLEQTEAETEDKIEQAGDNFHARWMRLRKALADISHYDVSDGMFRIRLGIRFQIDATAGTENQALRDSVGPMDDGVDFRRGRIFAAGRLFRTLDFKIEYDFAADFGLKDAYLEGSKYIKIMKWRIGQFKEPFSLGRQTGSNYLGFLEWALPVPALAPGRNIGIMLRHNESQPRLTWAASVTTKGKTTDDNRANSKVTLTARVTGLPVFRDDGQRLVHVGLSFSFRDPNDDTVQLSARPEARFQPFFADTGPILASAATLGGVEFATVQGPLWIQAEWIREDVDSTDLGDLSFDGAYIEAGWFLTGESRFYRTPDGTFGRLTPNRLFHGGNPFTGRGDGGALEVTGRYSELDLDSGPVTGGKMRDLSFGMNWYFTQATRVMFNYIYSSLLDQGHANIVLLRFQFNP